MKEVSTMSELGSLEQMLTGERKGILLGMIRKTLELHLGAGDEGPGQGVEAGGYRFGTPRELADLSRLPGYPEVREILQLQSGLFVTLRRRSNGDLRGCIGRMSSDEPLVKTLPLISVDAALRDRRFMPLSAAELAQVTLELSILSPMMPVAGYGDIILGTHGILLRRGFHSAVFLPEVPGEQGWDLETTLTRLSVKGGMSADAWRQADAEFRVFTSVHFSETDSGRTSI